MRVSGAAALFFLIGQLLSAQQLAVRPHKLANGMKLLIHEDHDIPNVALYLFFQVGSRNERSGVTGMSHFFEHMMFNGARKYGPKQFDIQMEKNGGQNNAYTAQDVTVYTDWFPAASLELMFDMESDRMRDLAFDPKIIESERGVVYSERRNAVENDNAGILSEQLLAAAFTAHPYHWPVIGWAADIEAWKLADLKAHFRMGYAPNNCTVVVAGAVREADVLRLARRYFEPLLRQNPPPPVHTQEPPQLGERRVTVVKPAQAPILMVGYHTPATKHADTPALETLARLLSQGRSARLYRRLVDQEQLALSADASIDVNLDPGLFTFSVPLRPGTDPARAEAVLLEEIARLAKEAPGEAELSKVRNLVLVDFYRQTRTIAGKANLIGRFEVYHGDHRRLNSYPADLAKVTAADVQRVARQYLTARNRTVATLVPEAAPAAASATAAAGEKQ